MDGQIVNWIETFIDDIYTEEEKPFYFHGTPMMTNAHLSKVKLSENKLPFCYLYEIIKEVIDDEPDSMIDRTADLRIFFLANANYKDWKTAEHYTEAVDPMRALAEKFVANLKLSEDIGIFKSHEFINHVNFGIFINEKGHVKRIFGDNLSGTELKIDLPFLKSLNC